MCVVFEVKMNKTFSLDIDLIRELRSKKWNQSEEVCKALRVHLSGDKEYELLSQLSTRNLAIHLKNREDMDGTLRNLIDMWLRGD
jgi:hypothetical protein